VRSEVFAEDADCFWELFCSGNAGFAPKNRGVDICRASILHIWLEIDGFRRLFYRAYDAYLCTLVHRIAVRFTKFAGTSSLAGLGFGSWPDWACGSSRFDYALFDGK
jgi:hypothetical protein